MKRVLFSIALVIWIMAFANVSAENKGSPVAIENSVSQNYINEIPACTGYQEVSAVTAIDVAVYAEYSFALSPAQTIAVDSGQGFRCSQSTSTIKNDHQKSDGETRIKYGWLHKPGTNTI